MTDEQINQRIAEACGWTEIRDSVYRHHKPCGYPPLKAEQGGNAFKMLPDYCADLNAMHEAEKVFDCPELYEGNLIKVCGGVQYMWHATARQRAEAFLRTIGKWENAVVKESLMTEKLRLDARLADREKPNLDEVEFGAPHLKEN